MGFSSIAIEQREKEFKALKSFLTFSTIASLAFHAAVIASGIGTLLTRTPDLEAEPIELTFIEPEVKETPLKEEKKKPEKPEKLALGRSTEVLTSSTANSGESALAPKLPKPAPINPVIPQQFIPRSVERPIQRQVTERPVTEKPSTPTKVEQPSTTNQKTSTQRLTENIPTQATNRVEKQDPVVSQTAQTQTNTTNTTSQTPTTKTTSTNTTTNNTASSDSLRNTLGQIRDARASQTVTGSGEVSSQSPSQDRNPLGGGNSTVAFSTTPGSGTDRGNRTANRGERGERRKREIAAAPTQPNLTTETEKPERSGNPEGSADGRAACRDCKVKYSERSRRRRAEGRVEVAVDTDSQGNVTNVRILNSSGDRELDEEHANQARQWKLKPSQAGRQSVKIATEYSIEGSRRNRQVRERQRQREERERQQQVASSSSSENSSQGIPRRRRRLEASVNNTDVPTTSRRRRSFETSESTANESSRSNRLSRRLRRQTQVSTTNTEDSTPRRVRRSSENTLGNRLRRRREITADVRTSGTQQPSVRRRRRNFNQTSQSSDSSSRLRNALRRSREVTPANPPSSEGGGSNE